MAASKCYRTRNLVQPRQEAPSRRVFCNVSAVPKTTTTGQLCLRRKVSQQIPHQLSVHISRRLSDDALPEISSSIVWSQIQERSINASPSHERRPPTCSLSAKLWNPNSSTNSSTKLTCLKTRRAWKALRKPGGLKALGCESCLRLATMLLIEASGAGWILKIRRNPQTQSRANIWVDRWSLKCRALKASRHWSETWLATHLRISCRWHCISVGAPASRYRRLSKGGVRTRLAVEVRLTGSTIGWWTTGQRSWVRIDSKLLCPLPIHCGLVDSCLSDRIQG